MNDCQDAAIRDQLPELLHDRLDPAARTVVLAHVDGCGDCRSELELLRGVQTMLVARTPRVDIQYVIGALPLAARRAGARPVARHRTWADWRIAAAVTVLAVGGGSLAVLHRDASPIAPVTNQAVATPTTNSPTSVGEAFGTPAATPAAATVNAATSTVATAGTGTAGIAMTGRLDDLSDEQLQTLLEQVGDLQAVPITEPDPVAIQVESTSGDAPEGA